MHTILITGGTGLIGRQITRALLEKNHQVIIYSRSPAGKKPAHQHLSYAHWDPNAGKMDAKALQSADYIIHLAGAGVADKRWTERRKKEIRESRVNSSQLIVKGLKENENKVKAVISASAMGWYGGDPEIPNPNPFREEDPPDTGFLGETCRLWEQSLEPIAAMGKRLVKLRTGIVLSREGGALPEFRRSLKFGVAAILGSGNQIISWIHMSDLVGMYLAAMENETWTGPYNAVAPAPVSNKEFNLMLGRIEKGKFFIPVHVPSFLLKWVLGEMSTEVLKSATLSCEKIREAGYVFRFPELEAALHDLR